MKNWTITGLLATLVIVLSLPLYPGLPDQAVERVARTVRDASE